MQAHYPSAQVAVVGVPAGHVRLQHTTAGSLIGLPVTTTSNAHAAPIPRLAKLTREERTHETAFAGQAEKHWDESVSTFYKASWDDELHTFVFETDGAKKLYAPYGAGKKPKTPEQAQVRAAANHALHPTAVAIARAAFLKRLDELARLPTTDVHRSVFVTNGGCAAGKGSLCDLVAQMHGGRFDFGAVWDAAGEGEGLENAWVLAQCQKRGLQVAFGYCDNNPLVEYQDVLGRALAMGRMVDVVTYARSYTRGAANMRAFLSSPAYKTMHAAGEAYAVGVWPGKFDERHLRNKSLPEYPQAHTLGHAGLIAAVDISRQPSESRIVKAAMQQLDSWRKAHPEARWFQGAIVNSLSLV